MLLEHGLRFMQEINKLRGEHCSPQFLSKQLNMDILSILESSLSEESVDIMYESENPTEVSLEEVNAVSFDVCDALNECVAVESALAVQLEMQIDMEIEPGAGGTMSVKIDFFERIKQAIKKIVTNISNFIKSIFKTIYDFFHERVIAKQTELIRKNMDVVNDYIKNPNSEDLEITALKMNSGLTVLDMISDMQFIDSTFNELIELINESVSDIEENQASLSQGLGIDGVSRKIESAIVKFKSKLVPGINPDLVSESELKMKLKSRYFGEEREKIQQNVKDILTSQKVIDLYTNPALMRQFRDLERKASHTVSTSNKRLNMMIERLQSSDKKKIRYTMISARFKSYRKLLFLFVYAISTYWEMFLISRNEVIKACMKVINNKSK